MHVLIDLNTWSVSLMCPVERMHCKPWRVAKVQEPNAVMSTTISCWCQRQVIENVVQAAFKRPLANSLGSTNKSESPEIDWDNIKPEDKTLAHQVTAPADQQAHDNSIDAYISLPEGLHVEPAIKW